MIPVPTTPDARARGGHRALIGSACTAARRVPEARIRVKDSADAYPKRNPRVRTKPRVARSAIAFAAPLVRVVLCRGGGGSGRRGVSEAARAAAAARQRHPAPPHQAFRVTVMGSAGPRPQPPYCRKLARTNQARIILHPPRWPNQTAVPYHRFIMYALASPVSPVRRRFRGKPTPKYPPFSLASSPHSHYLQDSS